MGCDIDGLIEVKGEDSKWKLHRHVDFEGTRDSPLWCYLFGVNCWKFNPPEYEDKYTGIVHHYVSSNDCSPEMKELMEEDDYTQLPQYITVKEVIEKFKYYEEVPEPYNRKYSGIYDKIFNEMKLLGNKFNNVRLIVWFDC